MKFSITRKDVVIPERCPVLGIPIGALRGATIDRVDNLKGYVRGNIVVISRRANRIKSDATIKELIMIAEFYGAWEKKADAPDIDKIHKKWSSK